MELEKYTDATKVETLLVGSIIIEPENAQIALEYVSGSQFNDPDLGALYELLVDLQASGFPISDTRLLVLELKKSGLYQKLGGGAIIGHATAAISSNCITYARQVKWAWLRREVERVGEEIRHESKSELDPEALIDSATGKLESIRQSMATDVNESLEDALASTVNEINEARKLGRTLGIPTGFPTVDDNTGGFHPGSLTILAARPSVGKSAFAMDVATRIAERRRPVFVVSLEMTGTDISYRMLSRKTRISVMSMQNGSITTDEQVEIFKAKEDLRQLPIKLYASTSATVAKIKARAKIHKSRGECSLVVIDYLGLISGARQQSVYERISSISRELKQLAMELHLPVLCLAQLNREATKAERPALSHLRDSGSIEQDADNVWLLHRKDLQSTDVELIIAKQRQGQTGVISLGFDPETIAFVDQSEGSTWEPEKESCHR